MRSYCLDPLRVQACGIICITRAALYSFGNSCSVKECEICIKDDGDGSASSTAVIECTRAGVRFLYLDGRGRLDVSRLGVRGDATWDCLRERGVTGVDALRCSPLWIRSPLLISQHHHGGEAHLNYF